MKKCPKCGRELGEEKYAIDYEAEQGSIHGTPVFICAKCYLKHEAEREAQG